MDALPLAFGKRSATSDLRNLTSASVILLFLSVFTDGSSEERDHWSYDLWMQRGKAYLITQKDYPSAAECFRRAIGQDPAGWEPYFMLAKAYESIGVMDHAWYHSNTAYHLARREAAKDSVIDWIARTGLHLVGGRPDSIQQYDVWATAWPESILDRRAPPILQRSSSDSVHLNTSPGTHMTKCEEVTDTASSAHPMPPQPKEWYKFSPPLPRFHTSEALEYPALAQEENTEGSVTIIATTDQNGRVVQAWAQEPAAPILVDAALEAVYRMRFTVRLGRPKPWPRSRILVPFRFSPQVMRVVMPSISA